jgi:hypothetical protein
MNKKIYNLLHENKIFFWIFFSNKEFVFWNFEEKVSIFNTESVPYSVSLQPKC